MAQRSVGSNGTITLFGGAELIKLLEQIPNELVPAMGEALYSEGQKILRESKQEVPFDRGVLSSSGRVHTPFYVGPSVAVEISYGGAAGGKFEGEEVNYAVIQHENTDFEHHDDRKPFYLQDPFDRAQQGMADRLMKKTAYVFNRTRKKTESVQDVNEE